MIRAVAKMLTWLHATPAVELAKAVSVFFPDVPHDSLARSLGRYQAAGLWSRNAGMNQQGFMRLAQSLHSGGFIAAMPNFDECVELGLDDTAAGYRP